MSFFGGSGGYSSKQTSYTGDGSLLTRKIAHGLGMLPTIIYILNLTDAPNANGDGVTWIVVSSDNAYIISGNDSYAPIPLIPNTFIDSVNIDIGLIQSVIHGASATAFGLNKNLSNYEMIARQ